MLIHQRLNTTPCIYENWLASPATDVMQIAVSAHTRPHHAKYPECECDTITLQIHHADNSDKYTRSIKMNPLLHKTNHLHRHSQLLVSFVYRPIRPKDKHPAAQLVLDRQTSSQHECWASHVQPLIHDRPGNIIDTKEIIMQSMSSNNNLVHLVVDQTRSVCRVLHYEYPSIFTDSSSVTSQYPCSVHHSYTAPHIFQCSGCGGWACHPLRYAINPMPNRTTPSIDA